MPSGGGAKVKSKSAAKVQREARRKRQKANDYIETRPDTKTIKTKIMFLP